MNWSKTQETIPFDPAMLLEGSSSLVLLANCWPYKSPVSRLCFCFYCKVLFLKKVSLDG
jgi:hypothetical protein